MILVLVLMAIMLFSGCNKEEKIMAEKRSYVSTSMYKVIDGDNDHEYQKLSDFAEKNKDKYVQWKVKVGKIDDSYTVIDYVDGSAELASTSTKVICEFGYSIKDKIKTNDEIIVSGKLTDWSFWSSKIILTNCRIEKLSEKELAQIKADEDEYYKKIESKNKAFADAEAKKKADTDAKIKAEEEANKAKVEADAKSKEQQKGWVRAPGRIYNGVKLYYGVQNEKMYVGEVLGTDDKHYDSYTGTTFRGVQLKMSSGSVEWKNRDAFIVDENWYVKEDDPVLKSIYSK